MPKRKVRKGRKGRKQSQCGGVTNCEENPDQPECSNQNKLLHQMLLMKHQVLLMKHQVLLILIL